MHTPPIVLRDESAGTSAAILVERGFNCFSFQAMHRGRPTELLWTADDFVQGGDRPSGSGTPILFPFPGRVRGARYAHGGRTYQLVPGDGRGNAIHGFVIDRPWEVIHRAPARVTGWFQASQFDPSILDRWPADFRLMVAYELAGNALRCEIHVENPSDRPLPWGLGTHAYFRVPLAPGGDAASCRIQVPAREVCELVDMLPTGRRIPAEGRRDLRRGLPFAETQLDDVFTSLITREGKCTASIVDPQAECSLAVEFDAPFDHCVVYNPGHRQAICIEPYTCVPGLFGNGDGENDTARFHEAWPIERALRLLPPGESVHLSMRVELRN